MREWYCFKFQYSDCKTLYEIVFACKTASIQQFNCLIWLQDVQILQVLLGDLVPSGCPDRSPDNVCLLAPVSLDRQSTNGHKPRHSIQSGHTGHSGNLDSLINLDSRINPDSLIILDSLINPDSLTNSDSRIISYHNKS